MPADAGFSALIEALGDEAEAVPKDLEVYRHEEPPPGYGLDLELEGVLAAAEGAGFDRFHLVGFSGGGAIGLALTAQHPDRVLSLALIEPAWAGNGGRTPEEEAVWARYDRIMTLPAEERMAEFTRVQVRAGVELPPPPQGDPPPWMSRRPAGVVALTRAFREYDLDLDALGSFSGPVYYALGELSSYDQFGRQGERLAEVFPDFTLDVYQGRHHFDPPHRAEPEHLARALRALWSRAG